MPNDPTLVRARALCAHDRRVVDQALAQARGLACGDPPPPVAGAGDDALRAACRIVAAASGIALDAGGPGGSPAVGEAGGAADLAARLAAIAEDWGLRLRPIRLEEGWWTRDHGAFVGLWGPEARPVALVRAQGQGRGWRLIDPEAEDGRPRRVTRALADQLAPDAVLLARPLPDHPLGPGDALRFALRDARRPLLTVVWVSLGAALLGLALPIATGILFSGVVAMSARPELGQLTLGLIAVAIGAGVFEFVRQMAALRAETIIGAELEAAIWDRLLKLPARFFASHASGDLASRANAVDEMRRRLGGATLAALLGGVFSLSDLALLFVYDGDLALVALGLVTVQVAAITVAMILVFGHERRRLELRGRLAGRISQLVRGIATLRVAAAEARAFAHWMEVFTAEKRVFYRSQRITVWLSVFNAGFSTVAALIVYAAAGFRQTPLAVGDFVAFNAAFGQFLAANLAMAGALPALLGVGSLFERVRPILAARPEGAGRRDGQAAAPLLGAVEVNQVSFRYGPDRPLALKAVSLAAPPGAFIGVVGPSGSGKSTLIRLLLGFEAPMSGAVFYDGRDLAGLDPLAVRRQIGVVLQQGQVLAGTIYENIIGPSRRSLDEAWAAAEAVDLADDIRRLPMGMHTLVQDGASTLSGGQRQRLMIARALVRRPRVLLFDEATSALDNRAQEIVGRSLAAMNVTRVVVAHRLGTIRDADEIHVLVGGQRVEHGRFAELLAEGGVFARLARRQMA